MNSAVQRKNMVDSQVRPNDVTDRRIPRAMLEVPREAFVPPSQHAIAYMDGPVPVGDSGQRPQRYLLAPRALAKLIQTLALDDSATVLDVGPGTGYSTAVLARIVKKVVAVESDPALAATAKATLEKLGVSNAEVHPAGLRDGVPTKGPFDAILMGGKVTEAPVTLLNQLKDGGRLVAILDVGGVGKAMEWRRFGMNFDQRPLFDAEAEMLPGFAKEAGFVF